MARHIFAISGVSGGAVGAAVFAAALQSVPPALDDDRCDIAVAAPAFYEDRVAKIFGDDHLSPLLARMLFPDLFQRVWPFAIDRFDRQLGLEFSLERSFVREFGQDRLSRSIYEVQPTAGNPSVPYLFLNTTRVESGESIALTPLYFLGEDFYRSLVMADIMPTLDVPLSAAAGASARFPYVSPAGYIDAGTTKSRYVDGGYFDNSGASRLFELFRAITQEYVINADPRIQGQKVQILGIHIVNNPGCDAVTRSPEAEAACAKSYAGPEPSGGLGEFLSPLLAVINARSARSDYAVRQLEREFTRAQDMGQPYFSAQVQMYDRGIKAPLGWMLSRRVKEELRRQLDGKDDCSERTGVENNCNLRELVDYIKWGLKPTP